MDFLEVSLLYLLFLQNSNLRRIVNINLNYGIMEAQSSIVFYAPKISLENISLVMKKIYKELGKLLRSGQILVLI